LIGRAISFNKNVVLHHNVMTAVAVHGAVRSNAIEHIPFDPDVAGGIVAVDAHHPLAVRAADMVEEIPSNDIPLIAGIATEIPGRSVVGVEGNMMNVVVFEKMIVAVGVDRLEIRVVDLVVGHPVAATIHNHTGCPRFVSAVEIMNAAVRDKVSSGHKVLLAPAPQDDSARTGVIDFATFDDMVFAGISVPDGIEVHVRMETPDLP